MRISPLKLARLELGLRQWDVARRVGITENLVCKIETGRVRPNAEVLAKIAAILGLTPDDLREKPLAGNAQRIRKILKA